MLAHKISNKIGSNSLSGCGLGNAQAALPGSGGATYNALDVAKAAVQWKPTEIAAANRGRSALQAKSGSGQLSARDKRIADAAAAYLAQYIAGVNSGTITQKQGQFFFDASRPPANVGGLSDLQERRDAIRIAGQAKVAGSAEGLFTLPEWSTRKPNTTVYTQQEIDRRTGVRPQPTIQQPQQPQQPTVQQQTPTMSPPVAVLPREQVPQPTVQNNNGVLDKISSGFDSLNQLLRQGADLRTSYDALRNQPPVYTQGPGTGQAPLQTSYNVQPGGGGQATSSGGFWDIFTGGQRAELSQPERVQELNKKTDTNTLIMLGAVGIGLFLLMKKR